MWGIYPTMDGVAVVFYLPPGSSPAQHSQFRRRIYGEETSSWGGRYRYRRKGYLDAKPHVRLNWGVVIVRSGDAARLMSVIRENGGIAHRRAVKLTKADERTLSSLPR